MHRQKKEVKIEKSNQVQVTHKSRVINKAFSLRISFLAHNADAILQVWAAYRAAYLCCLPISIKAVISVIFFIRLGYLSFDFGI